MSLDSNHIILGACIGLITLIALTHGVQAAECSDLIGCDSSNGDWSGLAKLNEIGNPAAQAAQSQASNANIPALSRAKRWDQPAYGFEDKQNKTQANNAPKVAQKSAPTESTPADTANDNAPLQRSDESRRMLASIDDISSSDILVDVSENSSKHIKGSVVLPYGMLDLMVGIPKSPAEIALVLGNAGISQNDSVVLYGDCLPCGLPVSPYVYWIMKSIGHENVRILDGNATDWAAAGGETTNESGIRPSKVYIPKVMPGLNVTYDYVKKGNAQIVDVRPKSDYAVSNIPGSINIECEKVHNNFTIKGDSDLKKAFAILSKDRPIVAYANKRVKGAIFWFALEMMGYDAKLYSYQDWFENQYLQAPENNTADTTA